MTLKLVRGGIVVHLTHISVLGVNAGWCCNSGVKISTARTTTRNDQIVLIYTHLKLHHVHGSG